MMIEGKRILITGGGGFIGVALAKQLVTNNDVTLLDRDFNSQFFIQSQLIGFAHTELINVLDKDKLEDAVKGYDIIIHTAAMVGVQKVLSSVVETMDVNYIGTSNLLKAVSNSLSCSRVIILSTSEVFGSNAMNVEENSGSSFVAIQNLRWAYATSKLATEYLAMAYHQKGLPIVIVRPFNIFGVGRVADYAVLNFILKALRNEDIEVYDNGTQIRSWCYVDDFCDAIIKCIETDDVEGETFNIGNPNNTITTYRLAKLIIRLCNSESKIVFQPIYFADINARIPDISKAKNWLKFSPKVELEEGLEKTIEWVRANAEKLH